MNGKFGVPMGRTFQTRWRGIDWLFSFPPTKNIQMLLTPRDWNEAEKCDPACVNRCFSPQDELRALYSDLIAFEVLPD
ncbi:hypothetical protein AV530_000545 [Patagioenas fasciata monilis]|uniref:Uncharacterized protein n=1 Tax=Patagioenas fasciata monilis TaxID=372326 RepID=A0A1V4IFQ7_PATFA|nr:hypothetical protein AV530_000545 [Patagioenas fasciata monilis]